MAISTANSNHDYTEIISKAYEIIQNKTKQQLYEHQKEALEKMLKNKKGIVQMPTGTGKTRLVSALLLCLSISKLLNKGDTVLFFAPRRVIISQTIEEFKNVLGVDNNSFRIYKLYNGNGKNLTDKLRYALTEDVSGIKIIVLTPHLLNEFIAKYQEYFKVRFSFLNDSQLRNYIILRYFEKVKCVILDEVHYMYSASKSSINFYELLNRSEFCFGLSATPTIDAIKMFNKSTENAIRIFNKTEMSNNRLLFWYTSSEAMQKNILIPALKIRPYKTTIEIDSEDSKINEWKVAIEDRAQKYAEEIINVLESELKAQFGDAITISNRVPKTLVVAANTTEADKIAECLCNELKKKDNINAYKLVSVAHYQVKDFYDPQEMIKKFRDSCEGILVTVNMADIGFDDPNLEVLVIARKVNTDVGYVQIRGRVLRKPDLNKHNTSKKNKCECDKYNLKCSQGYAILIDFTEASIKEQDVEKVESGYSFSESNKVLEDLRGYNEVNIVKGKVDIKRIDEFWIPKLHMQARQRSIPETKVQPLLFIYYKDKTLHCKLDKEGLRRNINEIRTETDKPILIYFYDSTNKLLDKVKDILENKLHLKINRIQITKEHHIIEVDLSVSPENESLHSKPQEAHTSDKHSIPSGFNMVNRLETLKDGSIIIELHNNIKYNIKIYKEKKDDRDYIRVTKGEDELGKVRVRNNYKKTNHHIINLLQSKLKIVFNTQQKEKINAFVRNLFVN